jgi:hypothetical protein
MSDTGLGLHGDSKDLYIDWNPEDGRAYLSIERYYPAEASAEFVEFTMTPNQWQKFKEWVNER